MSEQFALQSGMGRESAKAAAMRQAVPKDADKAVAASGEVKTSTTGLRWNKDNNVVAQDLDTVHITTVSMSADSADRNYSIFGVPLSRKSVEILIDAYKTALRGSHSHNQMLERFQQTMAANAMVLALSLSGVEAKDIQAIQANVRSASLAEIDAAFTRDYAGAKVTMKITGEIPENA